MNLFNKSLFLLTFVQTLMIYFLARYAITELLNLLGEIFN